MDTFSLTQEELADDVLWDEKGTHASQNTEPCSGANQLMPSRNTSLSVKGITKKPSKTQRKSKRGKTSDSGSIDDIIGILGKRSSDEAINDTKLLVENASNSLDESSQFDGQSISNSGHTVIMNEEEVDADITQALEPQEAQGDHCRDLTQPLPSKPEQPYSTTQTLSNEIAMNEHQNGIYSRAQSFQGPISGTGTARQSQPEITTISHQAGRNPFDQSMSGRNIPMIATVNIDEPTSSMDMKQSIAPGVTNRIESQPKFVTQPQQQYQEKQISSGASSIQQINANATKIATAAMLQHQQPHQQPHQQYQTNSSSNSMASNIQRVAIQQPYKQASMPTASAQHSMLHVPLVSSSGPAVQSGGYSSTLPPNPFAKATHITAPITTSAAQNNSYTNNYTNIQRAAPQPALSLPSGGNPFPQTGQNGASSSSASASTSVSAARAAIPTKSSASASTGGNPFRQTGQNGAFSSSASTSISASVSAARATIPTTSSASASTSTSVSASAARAEIPTTSSSLSSLKGSHSKQSPGNPFASSIGSNFSYTANPFAAAPVRTDHASTKTTSSVGGAALPPPPHVPLLSSHTNDPFCSQTSGVCEDLELTEEALAQILALEQAAMAGESANTIKPTSNLWSHQNNIDSNDNNNSINSIGAGVPSIVSGVEIPISSQQCDDFSLSEEALAQLIALEQQALEADKKNMTSMNSVNINATISAVASGGAGEGANVSSGVKAGQSVAPVAPALPPTRETLLHCMRLVALDVVDNPMTHTREVRAFQPGQSTNNANNTSMGGRVPRSAGLAADIVTVELSGDWLSCEILSGDIIHVVDLGIERTDNHSSTTSSSSSSIFTELASANKIVITNHWGLVIVNPDMLVSPTKIAESRSCMRRAVLTDRIRSFGDISAPAVMGNLKHAFIEILAEEILAILDRANGSLIPSIQTVAAGLSKDVLSRLANRAKSGLLEDLYLVGATDESIAADLSAIVEPTLTWVYNMLNKGMQALMQENNYRGRERTKDGKYEDVYLSGVDNNEETLCSAVLGMKGQIDMVARAKLLLLPEASVSTSTSGQNEEVKRVLAMVAESALPVEIKTGKWRASTAIGHRAQVMMYVLMMSVRDRCGAAISSQAAGAIPKLGVILYISPEELKVDLVKPDWADLRSLVHSRNQLAGYIRDAAIGICSSGRSKTPLPRLLRSPHECQYCYQAAECVAHHAALEGGSASSSGTPELFNYILKGVTSTQLRYFKHWDDLINLEQIATQSTGNLFCSEDSDKSLAGLLLQSCIKSDNTGDTFLLTFSRLTVSGGSSTSTANRLVEELVSQTSLSVNDRVQISSEAPSSKSTITNNNSERSSSSIGDMEDIGGLDRFTQQSKSIMNLEANICSGTVQFISDTEVRVILSEVPRRLLKMYSAPGSKITKNTFRITKDEISINISTMRSNLLALYVQPFQPKEFQQQKYGGGGGGGGGIEKSQTYPNQSNQSNQLSGRVGYRTNSTASLASMGSASSTTSITTSIAPSGSTSTKAAATSQNVTRWRQLIVDLVYPSFRAPSTLQDEILLMKPLQMLPATYQQALRMLGTFLQQGPGADSLKLTQQQITQLSLIGSGTSGSGGGGGGGSSSGGGVVPQQTCVSKGRNGELHVFGGLTVYPGCSPFQLNKEFNSLNPGQAAAVKKILLADDYALLLGLPGTGKTSTLSLVIRMMIARGQTVLLTSFTHSAVDNLLTKLIESGMSVGQVLRIGGKSSVQSSLHKYLLESKMVGGAVSSIQTACTGVRLVACTVLTASRSKLVRSMSLDCCIMDEAGQIAQPAALGAVLCARVAVLVGDDYQLPPLVVSIEAQTKGMNVSLFKRFMEAHPSAVGSLTMQYRMNAEIMSACNSLIYEHRMLCALPSIANATLQLPQVDLIPRPRGSSFGATREDWLFKTLQPSPAVVFLNTDNLARYLAVLMGDSPRGSGNNSNNSDSGGGGGIHSNNSISSEAEATIVRHIVVALLASGCDLHNVGIICPFRAQVGLVSEAIKPHLLHTSATPTATTNTTSVLSHAQFREAERGVEADRICEVSTVDKYQGRDKDVIILSTVKSCLDGKESVGNLLRDWRRINVAITRAKKKLIVVGSFTIMQQVPVLREFALISQQRGWTIDLPPEAEEMF